MPRLASTLKLILFVGVLQLSNFAMSAEPCGEELPDVEKRWLTVPVDHNQSGGKTLQVFYWIQRGQRVDLPPLLLLFGGPSGKRGSKVL